MEQTTWGVTLREIDGERFVVLPAGSLTNPPWTVGERPAVKLSRKWRSCMTALEQQLTTALRRLSEQFAQEQRQQTEQVETFRQRGEQQAAQVEALRQQVEQLAGRMTHLAADYTTPAGPAARALELMHPPGRRRGPERDHGPSR